MQGGEIGIALQAPDGGGNGFAGIAPHQRARLYCVATRIVFRRGNSLIADFGGFSKIVQLNQNATEFVKVINVIGALLNRYFKLGKRFLDFALCIECDATLGVLDGEKRWRRAWQTQHASRGIIDVVLREEGDEKQADRSADDSERKEQEWNAGQAAPSIAEEGLAIVALYLAVRSHLTQSVNWQNIFYHRLGGGPFGAATGDPRVA